MPSTEAKRDTINARTPGLRKTRCRITSSSVAMDSPGADPSSGGCSGSLLTTTPLRKGNTFGWKHRAVPCYSGLLWQEGDAAFPAESDPMSLPLANPSSWPSDLASGFRNSFSGPHFHQSIPFRYPVEISATTTRIALQTQGGFALSLCNDEEYDIVAS